MRACGLRAGGVRVRACPRASLPKQNAFCEAAARKAAALLHAVASLQQLDCCDCRVIAAIAIIVITAVATVVIAAVATVVIAAAATVALLHLLRQSQCSCRESCANAAAATVAVLQLLRQSQCSCRESCAIAAAATTASLQPYTPRGGVAQRQCPAAGVPAGRAAPGGAGEPARLRLQRGGPLGVRPGAHAKVGQTPSPPLFLFLSHVASSVRHSRPVAIPSSSLLPVSPLASQQASLTSLVSFPFLLPRSSLRFLSRRLLCPVPAWPLAWGRGGVGEGRRSTLDAAARASRLAPPATPPPRSLVRVACFPARTQCAWAQPCGTIRRTRCGAALRRCANRPRPRNGATHSLGYWRLGWRRGRMVAGTCAEAGPRLPWRRACRGGLRDRGRGAAARTGRGRGRRRGARAGARSSVRERGRGEGRMRAGKAARAPRHPPPPTVPAQAPAPCAARDLTDATPAVTARGTRIDT